MVLHRVDPERRARLEAALADGLAGLRRGVAARRARALAGEAQILERGLQALYQGLRARLQTLGVREHRAETDDFGMDPEVWSELRPFFDALFDGWWRIHVEGTADLASATPSLFNAESSAGLAPWDGLMLSHALARRAPEAARVRFLVSDALATRPFAQPALARLGGVRACQENVERLLRSGRSVIGFSDPGALAVARVLGVPTVATAITGTLGGRWRIRLATPR